jgi:hypothetical protein
MKQPVTSEVLGALPVHDAEFISLEVVPHLAGHVTVCLVIELHRDEPMNELLKLGIKARSIRLTYERCWQIVLNTMGVGTCKEAIGGWGVVKNSELLKNLRSLGYAQNVELKHHQIEFSGGSSVDVISEDTSIEEAETPPSELV